MFPLTPSSLSFSTTVYLGFGAILTYYFGWIAYATLFHPLKNIPGPFVARFSRSWIVYHTLRGDMEHEQRRLHEIHGSLIRVAPDEVACAAPDAIRVIYPMKSAPPKSDFYDMWQNPAIGKYNDHFSQRDEKVHAERRKIVSHIYSLANILQSEAQIDRCSDLFLQRMGEFADTGKVVDLGEWLQMYAFDVIGELFFGRMFGFMEHRHDHGRYIASLDLLLPFLSLTSVIPSWLRPMVAMSAFMSSNIRRAFEAIGTIAGAANNCVAERARLLRTAGENKPRRDLLQQMFAIQKEKGTEIDFDERDMAKESYSAIFAGSDTTAIAMRAFLYYLLTDPPRLDEVVSEIDNAVKNGVINDSGAVAYSQAIKLPLFCASLKEAMRLHPSVGLTLPRIVPAEGLEIAGTFIPGGYRIGMNAAVIQYDRTIFGEDSYAFRPQRWLSNDASNMNRHMLHFGAGTRTCLGKNISLSELHKLLPALLRDFRLELGSHRPWKTYDFFFNTQKGLDVRLHRRNKTM